MNNHNSQSNRNNIIPHDSNLRGYSVQNSFYDSPYNMDFEYGYLNLMFNITAFTARTQDTFQTLETNLYSIIELQNERRRLEFESQQTGEAIEARETNQNSNIPQPETQPASSQESRQNTFPSSTTNPIPSNNNLNSLFGTRNVFLGLNPMALYNSSANTGSNAIRFFRRNRNGLTIQEIEENTEIINYSSIDAEQILNTECPISRDVFASTSVVLRLKECRHCFVPFRMMTWLESHSTCPLCRCNVIPASPTAPTASASANANVSASANANVSASASASATPPATTFSNIINNIRNSTNLDNLSIDNMNDDSIVFSFDLPRHVNGETEERELTNTYLSSLSQIFSNLNRNTTNATNATNASTDNNDTLSEHEYEEVD